VAIQVVGRDVEQDRHLRAEGHGGFELKTRHLEHTQAARRPAGVSTASAKGTPKLPPTKVGRPLAARMAPHKVVVVDLPLVPVMATMGASTNHDASSSSPVIVVPRLRAASTSGRPGTPGDNTMRSAARKVSA